jgi:hypothetical protein
MLDLEFSVAAAIWASLLCVCSVLSVNLGAELDDSQLLLSLSALEPLGLRMLSSG